MLFLPWGFSTIESLFFVGAEVFPFSVFLLVWHSLFRFSVVLGVMGVLYAAALRIELTAGRGIGYYLKRK